MVIVCFECIDFGFLIYEVIGVKINLMFYCLKYNCNV